MKKLLIGALVLFSTSLFAQDVPAVVSKAFKAKFPAVKEVEWNQNDTDYEADFYQNSEGKLVKFDESGKWLETQTSYEEGKFPAVATKAVKAKYPKASVDGVQLIETEASSVYLVTASSETASYSIKTDKTGKILDVEEFANDSDDGDYSDDEE